LPFEKFHFDTQSHLSRLPIPSVSFPLLKSGVSPGEEMVGYGGKDLQKRKVLSLEWKSEGVIDDESGESMEPMKEV